MEHSDDSHTESESLKLGPVGWRAESSRGLGRLIIRGDSRLDCRQMHPLERCERKDSRRGVTNCGLPRKAKQAMQGIVDLPIPKG